MKKIFLIILILVVFYRQVYTLLDGWMMTRNASRLESEQTQYSHIINQNPSRNTRSIFVTETSESDGKIFFPDDEPKVSADPIPMYRPIGPVTACHNSTFCEDPPHYPTDFVKIAIRSRDDLRYLATKNTATEIGERFASAGARPLEVDSYDDDPLCLVQEQVVYPKSAENKEKEWVFVVNNDDFPQGVRIETCMFGNGPCRIIDGFAEGYTTACRQKYIYRQLAAITSDGTIGPDLFRFPSSCCCHVKFTGDPSARMGTSKKLINKEQSPRNKK